MARRGAQVTGLFEGERPGALSIADLFAQVHSALAEAFPKGQGLWVRGEIHQIADHRSGHCYIDLIDPDVQRGRDAPVLKVNCWRTTWGPLKALLSDQGITLEAGTVVTLRGRLEFYDPRAQVNFVATEIDVSALLGRLAAQRAALLRALEVEGLLTRNSSLPVADVPLRIGLVASPRTEGCNDFLGQLHQSRFGFHVLLAPVQVQGPSAPAAIAGALSSMADAGCDITVVVRGGGSKADLAAFDTEPVARAVATHPVPVWTGIGHTGDRSVADIVAGRSFVTPTECGQELVQQVERWWAGVSTAAVRIARRADECTEQAQVRDAAIRHRLSRATRSQLRHHREHLGSRATRVAARAGRQVESSLLSLERRSAHLGPRAMAVLDRQSERSASWRRLLAAYDVERQLERGYTLTMDDQGRIVRSAGSLSPGRHLVTRFADGDAHSTVDNIRQRPRA
ncbi:MAG TPA: exodeoxyribonuclease VII large subunit [Acidimicrobiales bacterium]|nr:exodeoxyribonuclease VII large subunit [Acidimicrobiales bacterium]